MNQERLLGNRYRLDAILGRGEMGTVCRAHDVILDRDVAARELPLPLDDANAQYRRARQAGMLRLPPHPGIAAVHDVLTESGRLWIVSELVGGRPLREVWSERGPLPASRVAEVGRQLLEALRRRSARLRSR